MPGEPKAWQTNTLIIIGLAAFCLFLIGAVLVSVREQIAEGDRATRARLMEVIRDNQETKQMVMEMYRLQSHTDADITVLKNRMDAVEKGARDHGLITDREKLKEAPK